MTGKELTKIYMAGTSEVSYNDDPVGFKFAIYAYKIYYLIFSYILCNPKKTVKNTL